MKHTLSLFAVALMGLLALTATVAAEVPGLMNYQGRLTDADGTPVADDTYEVTFRIYDEVPTIRWTEVHSVSTSNGLFSVQLGSNGSPLDPSHFDYPESWLGIQVGLDPEITPRTRLVTVPYAFRTGSVDGAEGGTITSPLNIGRASGGGILNVFQDGSASRVIKLGSYGGFGGAISLFDEQGNGIAGLEADGNGEGGYFWIEGGVPGGGYMQIDGNFGASGNPVMRLAGSASSTVINTNESGDNAVQLPTGSVHSDEILNEPGIASEQTTTSSGLSSVSMSTIETVTITIPDDGYILVQGKCYLRTYGTPDANRCSFQIDETSGGGNLFPYVTRAGASSTPTAGGNYYPIFVSRIYQKSAGEHTFIFEGMKDQAAGSAIAYHKIVTAMYFPTSYGTVMAMSENPGELPGATPVNALAGEEPGDYKTMYELDLRELELKAARLRAETLQAERDLMAAQMQASHNSSAQQ